MKGNKVGVKKGGKKVNIAGIGSKLNLFILNIFFYFELNEQFFITQIFIFFIIYLKELLD